MMAELESLNETEYLIVVNMTIVDVHAEGEVSPYSHLGYFTAELPCLKKSNLSNTDGTVITKEAKDWDRYKGLHGVDHLSVGDKITIQGSPYILTGFNSRARKAPINFKNSVGSGYKCSVRMLLNENSK